MGFKNVYDVVVVGAGAAGIGLGAIFEKMGLDNYAVLEKDTVGSSFTHWPSYTRFISPSFTGNSFNALDLNAVTPDTSPAYTLKTEHPSGIDYAKYLELVAEHFEITVLENTLVKKIEKDDEVFRLHTDKNVFQSRYVVWAGGEFQYPKTANIPGGEYCLHSSQIKTVEGDHAVIIGGFESGMELAIHLLGQGKNVTVVDAGEPWEIHTSDSSVSLAPYTRDRLRKYIGSNQLTLIGNTRITEVVKEKDSFTLVTDQSGGSVSVMNKPILATGFMDLPPVVSSYFMDTSDNYIALTDDDESTTTPGLFLAGPKVRHGSAIFCFIYKFRQRLPVVAETIGQRLGIDPDWLEEYKQSGMYLKDLSCCDNECAC